MENLNLYFCEPASNPTQICQNLLNSCDLHHSRAEPAWKQQHSQITAEFKHLDSVFMHQLKFEFCTKVFGCLRYNPLHPTRMYSYILLLTSIWSPKKLSHQLNSIISKVSLLWVIIILLKSSNWTFDSVNWCLWCYRFFNWVYFEYKSKHQSHPNLISNFQLLWMKKNSLSFLMYSFFQSEMQLLIDRSSFQFVQ